MSAKPVLLACPTCKKKISSDASACPNCAHPLTDEWEIVERKRKKRRDAVLGSALLIFIVWFFVGSLLQTKKNDQLEQSERDLRAKRSNPDTQQPASNQNAFVWTVRPDPSAPLNPNFRDDYGISDQRNSMENVPRSAAGYPVIIFEKKVPLCTNPFQLQLASDLYLAREFDKADAVASCRLFPEDTMAEWVKPNFLGKGYNEIRVPIQGKPPVTLYGPSANGPVEYALRAWIGTLKPGTLAP